MALIFTLCTIKIINNNKLQYLHYKMLLLKLLIITNHNIYIALCTIKLVYYTPFLLKVKGYKFYLLLHANFTSATASAVTVKL